MSKKIDFSQGLETTSSSISNQTQSFKNQATFHPSLLKLKDDKLLYSIREVAEITGMSYHFIAAKIRMNKIKAVQFGDRKFVYHFELKRILIEGIE